MKRPFEFISIFVTIVGTIIALAALVVALLNWLSPFNPVGNSPIQPNSPSRQNGMVTTATPQIQQISPTAVTESYDCTKTVTSSRPLVAHDSGNACWLQLVDGGAADITFDDAAQVTYRTSSSGDDIYFYIANVGDKLTDVVGATIRPSRFVIAGYGNYENVKQFEIEFHSPGGGWVACLRDANNNFQPLNSVCK